MTEQYIPTIFRKLGQIDANVKVGFGNVPNLIRERSKIEGFHINILAVGRRGLGTSTLINSLFLSPLIDQFRNDDFNTYKNQIFENEICLSTSITTYHQQDPIRVIEFIDAKNEEYFESEQGLTKPNMDTRIHLCIFMIPCDHIRHSEMEMMREIAKKCNLVPVISKADSFTCVELKLYKDKINRLITENDIQIFYPSAGKEEEDHEILAETKEMISKFPLAVFSSMDTYEHNGILKKGRMYNWGFLDIENEEINDFMKLRRLIVHNCLDELIYITDTSFYNEYRKINMESERIDDVLRKNRLMKIKAEMEKILQERNKKKLERIKNDMQDLEKEFSEKLNIIGKEKVLDNALNSS
ncbi:Cell division control protein 3 [Conglomerata obtusa]